MEGAMKTILLPLLDDDSKDGDQLAGAAITTAHLVANRFGSHIEGLFVKETPTATTSHAQLSAQYLEGHQAYWEERSQKARNRFTSYMASHDVPFADVSVEGESAGWEEKIGGRSRLVGEYGRLFDLIVVTRSLGSAAEDWLVICEAALFDSGRPVLVAPPEAPKSIGTRIVVAWNGSTETARTLAVGKPMLQKAEAIRVISVEGTSGGMVSGPSGDDVARHLAKNGVPATAKSVIARGRTAGAAILDEVDEMGADLLVKGAFTRSRLRQMIFGGTTRHILAEAKVPLLIAH
jgi:nucleotide-binding universal stress UspA family protein